MQGGLQCGEKVRGKRDKSHTKETFTELHKGTGPRKKKKEEGRGVGVVKIEKHRAYKTDLKQADRKKIPGIIKRSRWGTFGQVQKRTHKGRTERGEKQKVCFGARGTIHKAGGIP